LIGIGIAWLIVASSRSSRILIAATAEMAWETAEIGAAASAVVSNTSQWSNETATELVQRQSDVTTGVAGDPDEVPGAVAEKASRTVAPFELSDAVRWKNPRQKPYLVTKTPEQRVFGERPCRRVRSRRQTAWCSSKRRQQAQRQRKVSPRGRGGSAS
jgi:hypothetical protein